MSGSMAMTQTDVWTEMLDNQNLLQSQYDVLAGNGQQNIMKLF